MFLLLLYFHILHLKYKRYAKILPCDKGKIIFIVSMLLLATDSCLFRKINFPTLFRNILVLVLLLF